jgi:Cft2 family RNA processing exonuclease
MMKQLKISLHIFLLMIKFSEIATIQLEDKKLGLDLPGDICYISHAHSDHVKNKNKKTIIASQPTIDISGVNYTEKVDLKQIRLHRAGHMFGATQIEIQKDGENFVYTGDLSLSDGFTFKGAKIIEADSLLIEATYGMRDYVFPKREDIAQIIKREVMSRINYGNIIFSSYPTGKSQELIKILNEYCGITPLVSGKIAKISENYNKNGNKLSFINSESEEGSELLKSNFVGIVSKSSINPYEFRTKMTGFYGKPTYLMSLSGWNLKCRSDKYDVALPMSDHADYNELIEYVEYSNPKNVYVFGPFAETFSNVLRLKGYNSQKVK